MGDHNECQRTPFEGLRSSGALLRKLRAGLQEAGQSYRVDRREIAVCELPFQRDERVTADEMIEWFRSRLPSPCSVEYEPHAARWTFKREVL
jgi:hypothetical protein